jgi:hypothetical protein
VQETKFIILYISILIFTDSTQETKDSGPDGSKYSPRHHATILKTKKTARAFWNKVSKGTSILRNEDLNVLLASFMSTLGERGFSALQ